MFDGGPEKAAKPTPEEGEQSTRSATPRSEETAEGTTSDQRHPDLIWSDVAHLGAVDWWFALQVARSAADLVSAGWCPPPRGTVGGGCISGLLGIAERGLLLCPSDVKSHPLSTEREAREERLAASSSAAEAMCALANLGAEGRTPPLAVSNAVSILCGLLAVADPAMSAVSAVTLYPLGDCPVDAEEEEEWGLERETFLSQRESCLSDVAELLWSLLADRRSASSATLALLKAIDVDLSPGTDEGIAMRVPLTGAVNITPDVINVIAVDRLPAPQREDAPLPNSVNRKGRENQNHSVLAAGGAIRALGAALWGNPPKVKGVPLLRIYWCMLLGQIAKITISTNGPKSSPESISTSPPVGQGDPRMARRILSVPQRTAIINNTFTSLPCPCQLSALSLVVLLEVAVALRRLVDGEMAGSPRSNCLSPIEWDPFIDTIEALVPWLNLSIDHLDKVGGCICMEKRNAFLSRRIITETRAIFDRIEEFLASSDKSEGVGVADAFHPIVDNICRRRLHQLVLRSVCPILPPARASSAAASVIQSWMIGGFVSHRGNEWTKISSDLLGEVFAVYDNSDKKYGYPGEGSRRYVHPPTVRLEALRTAACDDGGIDMDFLDMVIGASRSSTALNSIRGNMKSSRLDLARTARELQLERVGVGVLLPRLREVLSSQEGDATKGVGARNRFKNDFVLAVPVARICPLAQSKNQPLVMGVDKYEMNHDTAIIDLYSLRRYSIR